MLANFELCRKTDFPIRNFEWLKTILKKTQLNELCLLCHIQLYHNILLQSSEHFYCGNIQCESKKKEKKTIVNL